MPKEKRINLISIVLFPIINPPLHNALIPAHYAPISTVLYGVHDNDAMPVSLLRNSMVLDRYTLWIIAYFSKTLICS